MTLQESHTRSVTVLIRNHTASHLARSIADERVIMNIATAIPISGIKLAHRLVNPTRLTISLKGGHCAEGL